MDGYEVHGYEMDEDAMIWIKTLFDALRRHEMD